MTAARPTEHSAGLFVPQPTRIASSRSRVLVVEDDLDQLRLIDIYLRRAGCSVEPTVSGEQAMGLDRTGYRFDLAIIDVNLPGMSGVQFAEYLRISQPWCRLVLTSVLEPGEIDSTEQVLPKPYTRAEVVGLLEPRRPFLPQPRSGES